MQNKLPPGLTLQRERRDNPSCNVLIAYDNAAAGLRAMRIFSRLAEDHQGELAFETRIWRFDLLTNPVFRKGADTDAMKADMLVISIGGEADLPAGVRGWLTACLSQKSGEPGAVVALFGTEENEDDPNSPRLKFLKRAAEKAGLHFFAPLPKRKINLDLNIESLYPSSKLINGNGYDLCEVQGYRHWGINE
jgi:hypothetical protein